MSKGSNAANGGANSGNSGHGSDTLPVRHGEFCDCTYCMMAGPQ